GYADSAGTAADAGIDLSRIGFRNAECDRRFAGDIGSKIAGAPRCAAIGGFLDRSAAGSKKILRVRRIDDHVCDAADTQNMFPCRSAIEASRNTLRTGKIYSRSVLRIDENLIALRAINFCRSHALPVQTTIERFINAVPVLIVEI